MICPDCIETLIPDRKQLGNVINWMVCPKCGLRTRRQHVIDNEREETVQLSRRNHVNNLTGGKKNSE